MNVNTTNIIWNTTYPILAYVLGTAPKARAGAHKHAQHAYPAQQKAAEIQ